MRDLVVIALTLAIAGIVVIAFSIGYSRGQMSMLKKDGFWNALHGDCFTWLAIGGVFLVASGLVAIIRWIVL